MTDTCFSIYRYEIAIFICKVHDKVLVAKILLKRFIVMLCKIIQKMGIYLVIHDKPKCWLLGILHNKLIKYFLTGILAVLLA